MLDQLDIIPGDTDHQRFVNHFDEDCQACRGIASD
jgi:hypothetical protein